MVDWCQEVMGFLALPLLLPEASHTGGSAEFEGLGLLVASDGKGVLKTGFGFSGIIRRLLQEEFAFEAIQLWFVPTSTSCVHDRQRFREYRESCLWFPLNPMCFG